MSKNILVTGVSQGLGLAITQVLLQAGWCVYGISRRETDELKRLSASFPGKLHWRACDLANARRLHAEVFKEFVSFNVRLDGFVNNAAIAYDDIISNLDLDRLEGMFAVNVFSPMVMTKYFLRHCLFHRVRGAIVHLSSISVHTGYKGLAMYASTKGALEAFSKNTAREWGERGIRSNCLVAGFMETSMSATLTAEQKQRIFMRTSLKQAVSMESVAHMVRFLLSDEAQSVTGQNVFVDAGTI